MTINIGGTASPGTYTLLTYGGSLLGSGSAAFVLGSQPASTVRATTALLFSGNAIDWVVTGGGYPIWTGANGGQWVGGNNWNLNTGGVTDFLAGDKVLFDDSATGTTAVAISGSGNVTPGSVTFNNNSQNYSVSGPYGIVGAGGMTLNGAGTVTISSPNGYTGGTSVNAGLLQVGNASTLGSGSLSINNAALSSSSVAAYSLPNPLSLSGSVTLGSTVNNGGLAFTAASATLAGNSVLAVKSPVTIYSSLAGAGASLTVNGPSILTLAGTNSYSGGTTVSGGALSIAADANLGAVPGSIQPASITLNGGALQISGLSSFDTPTISSNRGITLGPAGGTIDVPVTASGLFSSNESSVQYAGVVSGPGGLTVTGGSGTNSTSVPTSWNLADKARTSAQRRSTTRASA